MQTVVRVLLSVGAIVLLCGSLTTQVHAAGVVGDGTAASCDDTAVDNALSGGGSVTFKCGGAKTIIFNTQKIINADTVVDGGGLITLSGANATRLFLVMSPASLTLNNIILTNGYDPGDGGAIYNTGALVLNHSTIQNSLTSSQGSGAAIVTYGPLTITDSTIAGNNAANGGALYLRGGHTLIRNSVLRQNATTSTTDGWGGAILLWDGTSVEIQGSELFNNQALQGGAIHNRFAASSITLNTGTRVHDNSATSGGGIYNLSGTATLTNVTFQGNLATIGGGLYNEGGTASLTNVTLQANRATEGGGISTHSGTATLRNVAVNGNSATEGAGIYNSSGTTTLTNGTFQGNLGSAGAGVSNYFGTATLTNATFQGNAARNGPGGGISNVFGTLTLTNATLQGNGATTTGGGINNNTSGTNGRLQLKNVVIADSPTGGNCGGTVPDSAAYSLSSDTTCNWTGIGNLRNTRALLGALQDNGGGLLTLLPRLNSPLIDAGLCVASVPTDERGLPRPQGAACDIGAVEVQPTDLQPRIFLPLTVR